MVSTCVITLCRCDLCLHGNERQQFERVRPNTLPRDVATLISRLCACSNVFSISHGGQLTLACAGFRYATTRSATLPPRSAGSVIKLVTQTGWGWRSAGVNHLAGSGAESTVGSLGPTKFQKVKV